MAILKRLSQPVEYQILTMTRLSDTNVTSKVQALRRTAGPWYNIEGFSEWSALPGADAMTHVCDYEARSSVI